MFKKIQMAVIALTCSSAVLASSPSLVGAPYVGASVGVNDTLLDIKIVSSDAGGKLQLGGRSPSANIFGGYGAIVQNTYYVGGELFANTAGGFYGVLGSTNFVKYRTRYTYGVSFIPGILLTQAVMLYGRAGIVKGSFNFNGYASLPDAGDPIYYNKNENLGGLQGGVGIKANLTQHVDLRGEYVYTDYRTFTLQSNKYSTTSDQFNLGLLYNFG